MGQSIKSRVHNIPKISVVMPCFNSAGYIERTISSVVEQGYPKLELFIKDGGSEDGTVEIIKHYAKRYPKVIRWVSKKDKGQADAINYGMARVSGEILTYLNADDIYKPWTLLTVGGYFRDHPETMWAYGKCDIIDAYGREIRRWITVYKNFWLKQYSYSTLLVLNYISQMSCFWRREAAKKVGEFDQHQHYVLDYDYWLRLGKIYPAGVIDKYLASFRVVPGTKSSTGFLQQFRDELMIARIYTKSQFIIFLHRLHYFLIVLIYSMMKLVSGIFLMSDQLVSHK